MTYLQAVACLNSFINYENKNNYPYKKLVKLEGIQGFLRRIGNPQESLKCLHIAGTKGKGSVCIFAASILRGAGYNVGLYTSPHLVDWRERIRVLRRTKDEGRKTMDAFEGMISKRELAVLVNRLKPYIEEHNRISKYGSLTFFEVWTALAFVYFKEQKVDYAVLETGLGGRLDATNTVNPLACGITPISYDHMDLLGKSLAKIAKEKAGIINSPQSVVHSPELIVISAPQEKEVREIIRKRCKETGARLYEVGRDILWHRTENREPRTENRSGFQSFAVKGREGNYDNLKTRLLGEYQLDNAALAIGMVEVLPDEKITPLAIRRGLKEAVWPGRFEVVSRQPYLLLDGAQNAASARVLKEAVKKYYTYRKLILVLGISGDKDIRGVCKALDGIADRIILTKARNPRAEEPENIKKFIEKPSELTSNVQKAIAIAKRAAAPQDLILITGSLFVVGEARKILLKAVKNS